MSERFYRLGCDIGGTFTDFVLLNDKTGEMRINKCLTTPSDPSDAVEQGIRQLEDVTPGFVQALDEVIHGTTLVINSIIERKGAKTGLITTKGFRDVLELGREIRYAPYDVFSLTNAANASLRTQRYKLMLRTPQGQFTPPSDGRRPPCPQRFELYDLLRDPGEKNNLARADIEKCKELAQRLSTWMEAQAAVGRGETLSVGQEQRRALQERGYWEVVSP